MRAHLRQRHRRPLVRALRRRHAARRPRGARPAHAAARGCAGRPSGAGGRAGRADAGRARLSAAARRTTGARRGAARGSARARRARARPAAGGRARPRFNRVPSGARGGACRGGRVLVARHLGARRRLARTALQELLRVLVCVDHRIHVGAVELGALELRKLVIELLVLVVERAGHLQALAAGGGPQLLERLGVLVDHHLRELLDLRILRLLQRELAQLNFGHVRHGGLLDELLQVVAAAAALRAGGSGARLPARATLVASAALSATGACRGAARATRLAAALRPARAGALRRNRWDTCRRRPHERRTRGRDYLYSSHGSLLTRGGYTRLSACGNRRRRLTVCNVHALNRLSCAVPPG